MFLKGRAAVNLQRLAEVLVVLATHLHQVRRRQLGVMEETLTHLPILAAPARAPILHQTPKLVRGVALTWAALAAALEVTVMEAREVLEAQAGVLGLN